MHCDPRGGHNKKSINHNFFKSWSPPMAYTLGFIFADGAIFDARDSSRTCYVLLSNNDKYLLEQIKKAMSSSHSIYTRKPRTIKFNSGKYYKCKESYVIRIGSKNIFTDLCNMGLSPRKSLTIKLPEIPTPFFSFFLRGYFDGDGSVHSKVQKGQKLSRVQLVFTSGSHQFLKALSYKLNTILNIPKRNLTPNGNCYQLRYRKHDSVKLLSYMYQQLNTAPYIERKYHIFVNIK
jgi:hypothetical protein